MIATIKQWFSNTENQPEIIDDICLERTIGRYAKIHDFQSFLAELYPVEWAIERRAGLYSKEITALRIVAFVCSKPHYLIQDCKEATHSWVELLKCYNQNEAVL